MPLKMDLSEDSQEDGKEAQEMFGGTKKSFNDR
jgi:hypothetical protein